MRNVKPNFLIAGGVASGTSFLSSALMQHKDVYLPREQRPEPNFFHYSWKYEKGINWWLKKWFDEVKEEPLIGERSSLLFNSLEAPERIFNFNKEMKLIFCLRNPYLRSWANYRFSVLEGLEQNSFSQALLAEEERTKNLSGKWGEVKPFSYIERSKYLQPLKKYISLFGTENILLLKSEGISSDPIGNFEAIFNFLKISSVPIVLPKNYSSPTVKNREEQIRLRNIIGDEFSLFTEFIRTESSHLVKLNNLEEENNFKKLVNNLSFEKEEIDKSAKEILKSALEPDLKYLKEVLPFDISDWTI